MMMLLKIIVILLLIRVAWVHLIAPFFRKLNEQEEDQRSSSSSAGEMHYLSRMIPLLAKMAKSDGAISRQEINHVESIFEQLRLNHDQTVYAQELFNRTKADGQSFEAAAIDFARTFRGSEIRLITFRYLAQMAVADGMISESEINLLLLAARIFGIPQPFVFGIFQQEGIHFNRGRQQQQGYRSQQERTSTRPSESSRTSDLALLGLAANASSAEIKKAYRAKVKELHPDRLQAQGLPAAMLKKATERMAEINAAYDRLTK